jgi:hypothetical protein
MPSTYSLVMTNLTYVIDEAAAKVIEDGLERDLRTVQINCDMSGSGNVQSRARIVLSHVMAIVSQPETTDEELVPAGNVYALPLRR